MKKLALLPFLIALIAWSPSNEVVVKHHRYTTYYNPSLNEPDSVHWLLTASMGACNVKLGRTNKFIADPQIQNTQFNKFYDGSGYDQGHQFDADDASCSQTDEAECWYFSNMVPQRPNLNRITWRGLENYSRKLAAQYDVSITCGVTGTLGTLTGTKKIKQKDGSYKVVSYPSQVNIPKYCWKWLEYSGKVEYYIMPNQDTVKNHPFTFYRVYSN